MTGRTGLVAIALVAAARRGLLSGPTSRAVASSARTAVFAPRVSRAPASTTVATRRRGPGGDVCQTPPPAPGTLCGRVPRSATPAIQPASAAAPATAARWRTTTRPACRPGPRRSATCATSPADDCEAGLGCVPGAAAWVRTSAAVTSFAGRSADCPTGRPARFAQSAVTRSVGSRPRTAIRSWTPGCAQQGARLLLDGGEHRPTATAAGCRTRPTSAASTTTASPGSPACQNAAESRNLQDALYARWRRVHWHRRRAAPGGNPVRLLPTERADGGSAILMRCPLAR